MGHDRLTRRDLLKTGAAAATFAATTRPSDAAPDAGGPRPQAGLLAPAELQPDSGQGPRGADDGLRQGGRPQGQRGPDPEGVGRRAGAQADRGAGDQRPAGRHPAERGVRRPAPRAGAAARHQRPDGRDAEGRGRAGPVGHPAHRGRRPLLRGADGAEPADLHRAHRPVREGRLLDASPIRGRSSSRRRSS